MFVKTTSSLTIKKTLVWFKALKSQLTRDFLYAKALCNYLKNRQMWSFKGWGSCVTRRSVTPFTSWANNPHHFQASILKRMLCVQSCPALSQPQLYHFKSLATELFVYKLHSPDCMTNSLHVGIQQSAHAGTSAITLEEGFSAQGFHLVAMKSVMLENVGHPTWCITTVVNLWNCLPLRINFF